MYNVCLDSHKIILMTYRKRYELAPMPDYVFPSSVKVLTLVSAIACSAGSLSPLLHHVIMTLYRVALNRRAHLVKDHLPHIDC